MAKEQRWPSVRLKNLCSESAVYGANIPADEYADAGVRFIRTTDITEGGDLRNEGVYVPRHLVEQYLLNDGDILLSRSGTVGRTFLYEADKHGPCSYASYLVKFRASNLAKPRFVNYCAQSPTFQSMVQEAAISSTIENVNAAKYANFPIPLPPPEEQAAIVRFLDHTAERIQRYIAGKERLIALLEEERQALVHQAVTRGLDSSVRLKPSGIEGAGDVPEHWELCRLRNVVSEVTTGSRGWSSYASDTGPLFIRIANLNRGSLKLRFDSVVRLNLPRTSEATRSRIRAGDLLVSVTAYIGSVGIAPKEFEEAYVSQHVARCQPHPGSCSEWLGYVLLSTVGQAHGQISLYGGTKDGLSLDDVKNYPILLPPPAEQIAIVEYVNKASADMVAATNHARRQIDLMNEYRTRLIADVVTGQLDVRETAAQLQEAPWAAPSRTELRNE